MLALKPWRRCRSFWSDVEQALLPMSYQKEGQSDGQMKGKMTNLDRRKLLHAGIAWAVPLGTISLLSGCKESADVARPEGSSSAGPTNEGSPGSPNGATSNVAESEKPIVKPVEESEGKSMQVKYLEIVTADVEALVKQYSAVHGITFGEADVNLGNARVAQVAGGGMIGIRGPMRESEAPVIRPYTLVENLEEAVAAAAEAGAEVALPRMEIPGHGTIAIVILGGIECGFWQ